MADLSGQPLVSLPAAALGKDGDPRWHVLAMLLHVERAERVRHAEAVVALAGHPDLTDQQVADARAVIDGGGDLLAQKAAVVGLCVLAGCRFTADDAQRLT